MLYSMTGYGEAVRETERIRVGFRLKAVNNKSLDLSIKLPFDLMYLDPSLRRILKNRFFRGRIDLFSEIEVLDESALPPAVLNQSGMMQLLNMAAKMKQEPAVSGEVDINTLLRIPDLITTQRLGYRLPADMETVIEDTLGQAADRLLKSRQTEGEQLGKDCLERLAKAKGFVEAVELMAQSRQSELRAQMLQKVQKLIEDPQIDENRLSQEIVHQSDRLDISEEITRLWAHFETTESLLKNAKRPLGKELDFMIQEQFREVTTIGNKARHKGMADLVVKLKTSLEKIREQIQNIE